MKKLISFLPFLLYMLAAQAQDKNFAILGKVIDSASGLPLAGASAYCQNTTYGTISNNDGLFYLRLPNGGYDLVITYTGYEKRMIRLSNKSDYADTLTIALVKQEKTMEEVAVVATNEVADGWAKYGQFFTDYFIGTTPNASQCTLENPQALHFFYSKKRQRLKVTADTELLVKNYALGYLIRYQLDSFSYDYASNISQYTGSPFFIEMDSTDPVKTTWKQNRAHTYLGSRLHFMRSLYDSVATEEGFIVEKLESAEGDSQSIQSFFVTDLYAQDEIENDTNNIADTSYAADSIRVTDSSYVKNSRAVMDSSQVRDSSQVIDSSLVMNSSNTADSSQVIDSSLVMNSGQLTDSSYVSDSSHINDNSEVVIHWAGKYRISYRSVFPDKKFLQEFNLPANTRFQITVIDLPNGFVIKENGYFYEQYDVINTGYWAWKKLAELLPYDY
ncbi:MAG TPA: carboxypeptidase-like regulatory domain-containing protein, partial [Chitinophagaceae bacterium]|nr:carboxypeptidase-like regulatory domain-containing protein [Chitinophagaceae bacterium]